MHALYAFFLNKMLVCWFACKDMLSISSKKLPLQDYLDYLDIADIYRLKMCSMCFDNLCGYFISLDGPCVCYPSREKRSLMSQPRIKNLVCIKHDLLWDGEVFRSPSIIPLGNAIKILSKQGGSRFERFRYITENMDRQEGYGTGYFYSYHESEACAIMFHGRALQQATDSASCLKVCLTMTDGTDLCVVPSSYILQRDQMFNMVVPQYKQLFRLEGQCDRTGLLCVTRKQVDVLKRRGFLKKWIKFFSWVAVHETVLRPEPQTS